MPIKGVKLCGAKCRTKNGGPCLQPEMKNGRCRKHGGCEEIYSVRELAASMNVQYEEIQEIAVSDESLSEILEMCRMHCFSRAMKDGLYKKLSFKKSVKYMEENDDDFKVPEGFQEVEDDDDFSDENEVEEDAIFEF